MNIQRTFGVDELDALVQKHRIDEKSPDVINHSEDDRLETELQKRIEQLNIKAVAQTERFKTCQERLRFYQSTPDQHLPEQSSQQCSNTKLHQ
mgnify:CR=1 FL=1|jgi:hypothetical protein|tara:strand:- start:18291 stop:18569 length:279 start_codon:yes stop_codon:yes gene_type:complete